MTDSKRQRQHHTRPITPLGELLEQIRDKDHLNMSRREMAVRLKEHGYPGQATSTNFQSLQRLRPTAETLNVLVEAFPGYEGEIYLAFRETGRWLRKRRDAGEL